MKKPNAHLLAFSLVEILVVLGLFSAIATLSLGSLFSAQVINARLQETQSILDNVNLSIQTITREVRFGSEFYATSSPFIATSTIPTLRRSCLYGGPNICQVLIFKPEGAEDGRDRVALYVKDGVLYKGEYPYNKASSTLQMTSNDIRVTSLIFYVRGANTSEGGASDEGGVADFEQPFITLLISGRTKPSNISTVSSPFSIQAGVSAREVDR